MFKTFAVLVLVHIGPLLIFNWFQMMASPPSESELNEFHYILKIHKYLVAYLGNQLNGRDYESHDNSKFNPPEIEPYTLKFVRLLPDSENPGWDAAKEHHFKTNKHHAQYWRYLNMPMPVEEISEAVIDMLAAKFQYQLNPNIVEAVRYDGYNIDMEKLMQSLHEYMQQEEFYTFKERYLEPYTDDEKDFIYKELNKHKSNVLRN